MNELEFKKFISYQECTSLEFKNAEKFYQKTKDYSKKKQFLLTCFSITREIIKKMLVAKKYDILEFKDIYLSHGLSDNDFTKYYYLYFSKFMPLREKEILHKFIFELCKECLWQEDKLSIIAKSFLISKDELKRLNNEYFETTLHLKDFKEYKRLYKKYILFINNNLSTFHDLELAYSFYLKYANKKEKEIFQKTASKIIKKALKSEDMEKYVQTLNLKSLDIYFLAENFTPELTEIIANSFKIYYDFCVYSLWNIESITKEAKCLNIKYPDFYNMAKIYCRKILKKDIKELRQYQINQGKNNDLSKMEILSKIYNSTDIKEYFSLIEKSDITYGDIYYFCYIFNKNLPDTKKQEMEINIKEKFSKYSYSHNKSKIDNTKILLDFLNSFYTLEEYAKIFGYSYHTLKEYLRNCKDPNILKRYKEKLQNEKNARETYRNNLVLNILNFIKNGFRSDNNTYPFTLIDAYILFPNINFLTLKTGSLSLEDAKILRNFFNPLKNACKLSKETIIIKYKKSNIDLYTEDELIKIIDFMEYYNIPLNDVLLNEMLTRYKNNTLTLYEFNTYMLK